MDTSVPPPQRKALAIDIFFNKLFDTDIQCLILISETNALNNALF